MKKIYDRIMFDTDEPKGGFVEESTPVADDQIEDLEDLLSDEPKVEETPVEEPSPEPESGPEVVDEPEESIEPVAEETPAEPVEPVEEPPTELTEIEELRATVARLTEIIEKQSGGTQPTEPSVEQPSVAEPTQVPSPPAVDTSSLNLVEMFKDTDLTDVMETKEGFLGFMQQILDAAREVTKQNILTTLPNVVGSYVTQQTALRDVHREFYQQYPELKNVKRYVGSEANRIHAENPQMSLPEILKLTAETVKKDLNIKEAVLNAETATATKPKKPVLPGATGGVRTKPAPSNTLQDEIADLVND